MCSCIVFIFVKRLCDKLGQFVEMMAINFKSELTNEKYEEQF